MALNEDAVRDHVRRVLEWKEAHATYDDAVDGLPAALRGRVPGGLPYSAWHIVEHLRITQRDILEFCRNPVYQELDWPDDYWPDSPAPPDDDAWERSIAEYRADRQALQAIADDRSNELSARIPHGNGQTYLRELLLAADHAAYHVGELIVVRRLLGAWK